jgi:two-component system alkaline phosphatase synthesis response regulator PhoP
MANILVVDDEPALLESMRSYLSRLGHVVAAFGSAASAWECFAAGPSAHAAVIVDMTLSGMSGEEFIEKVRGLNPGVRILAMSGYSVSLRNLHEPQGARIAILEKPFTPRMLTEALDRLLAS